MTGWNADWARLVLFVCPLDRGLLPRPMGEGVGAPVKEKVTAGDDARPLFEVGSIFVFSALFQGRVSLAALPDNDATTESTKTGYRLGLWRKTGYCGTADETKVWWRDDDEKKKVARCSNRQVFGGSNGHFEGTRNLENGAN